MCFPLMGPRGHRDDAQGTTLCRRVCVCVVSHKSDGEKAEELVAETSSASRAVYDADETERDVDVI